ncbi:MAG: YkgJ family cysteine cluster protein [Desulfobacterales bacterium]|nr:YkgJ family cysteine cluster protein [Desulfobacterales bacterium]MBF0398483.1 YkgJ family cysteine cluster protein [Desulfobacterales bacterium]
MKTIFPDISYFFDNGIYFKCNLCGLCCTGEPGIIYVSKNEIIQIALFQKMKISYFIKKYLYPYKDSYSIKEDKKGSCLFFSSQKGCLIYPVRPIQCNTFPFWLENLRSLKNWQNISKRCPGIGYGDFYSKEKIIEIVGMSF